MSKSLGNLYTLEDLAEKGYKPQEIRYLLLSGNYRQSLNFTFDSLGAARKALSKLTDFSNKFQIDPSHGANLGTDFGPFYPVQEALFKDLNTPEALGRLFKVIRQLSETFDRGEIVGKEDELNQIRKGFLTTMDAFGFITESKKEETVEVPEEIQQLAKQRWEAKVAKDWELADQLRSELTDKGWKIKDAKDGFELAKVAD